MTIQGSDTIFSKVDNARVAGWKTPIFVTFLVVTSSQKSLTFSIHKLIKVRFGMHILKLYIF